MPQKTKPTAEQRRKALAKLRRQYSHRDNITGFDIGYRWTNGKPTKELCIRIHVTAKIPLADLAASEIITKSIDGIPVDVIIGPYRVMTELGFGAPDNSTTILSGSGCKRGLHGTGTIGAIALDKATGEAGILSNWHVLSTYKGTAGDPIYGTGGAARPIAHLAKAMLSKKGDAAFATFNGPQHWLPALQGLNLNLSGVRDSQLGEILCKYGRTTGLTRARVDGEGVYKVLHTTGQNERTAIEIEGFRLVPETASAANTIEISSPGDSGAGWVNPNSGEVIGLHMAGEGSAQPDEEYALACNMTTVLDQLGLKLATLDDLIQVGAIEATAAPEFMSRYVANSPAALGSFAPLPNGPPCPMCGSAAQPPAHFNQPAHYASMAAAEAAGTLSLVHDIWPEFLHALHRRYPNLVNVPIGIDDKLNSVFLVGIIPALVHRVIRTSPQFVQGGVIPPYHQLQLESAFRGVCKAIGDEYQHLGYTITS